MFSGKKKAITFSYDDGVTQDKRLIDIFNKYGLKCTFNLNSELCGVENTLVRNGVTVSHNRIRKEDVKYIYDGHEVAAHTLTHPCLPKIERDDEVIRQVEQDRINLSEIVGYEVCGMAYPCGGQNNDDRTADLIRQHTGVKYARALATNGSFRLQKNLYRFEGTVYHHDEWDKLFELGEKFLALDTDESAIFYIWGHAYEFDIFPERWQQFEEFCQMMSGRKDIFYGTNKEVLLVG
ncbi:MAG: polysaccharide deacetylase family protein [Lachnospiraceae bacterium]|nr:polysaccharide deacetylase family protein [Lachnospiraceae bacterium]